MIDSERWEDPGGATDMETQSTGIVEHRKGGNTEREPEVTQLAVEPGFLVLTAGQDSSLCSTLPFHVRR